jgi:hypothetical protein
MFNASQTLLLKRPDVSSVYNVEIENLAIQRIAKIGCERAEAKTKMLPSNYPRFYRVKSEKLLGTGSKHKKTVKMMSIDGICSAYRAGQLQDRERFQALEHMQKTVYNLASA